MREIGPAGPGSPDGSGPRTPTCTTAVARTIGKSNHEEGEGEGREPFGKAEVLGKHIHDLQSHPGTYRVDAQHLPQRAAVNLLDELLHAVNASMTGNRSRTRNVRKCAMFGGEAMKRSGGAEFPGPEPRR